MLFLLCLATFKTSSSLHLHCQGIFELMRTRSCIFFLLQVPRCSIHSLAKCREDEALCGFIKIYGNKSSIRLLGSRIDEPERGFATKLIKRLVTTREGSKQSTWNTKLRSIKHESFREEILPSATVNENTTQLDRFQKIQWPEVQEIAQYKNLSDLLTVFVFDVETTGYSRVNDRIIDIALRDLQGGEHSTFQTLVNPQCHVPNSHVHGIATHMVNRTDVPRMEDLVPILLQYIRSREKHGGYVLWIAHNVRAFDAPFLMHEFIRCSMENPHNWLFLDTLPLARQLIKTAGFFLCISHRIEQKHLMHRNEKILTLHMLACRNKPFFSFTGSAHRAMVDVNTLSQVLPVLTSDLKLTLSSLVKKSFNFSDLKIRAKKR